MSGVTGVGGGIFLAPLGWATTRQTAAISVVFNLVNSAPRPCRDMGDAAAATRPVAPMAGLRGNRWTSRLMDGCVAPQPKNLAVLLAILLVAAAGRMIGARSNRALLHSSVVARRYQSN